MRVGVEDKRPSVRSGGKVGRPCHNIAALKWGRVVEVADTSLGKDRGEKLLAYGRGGVPVYWIVNLADNQIEVYSEPDRNSGGYARCMVHAASDSVPLEIEDAEAGRVAVSDVLPRESP